MFSQYRRIATIALASLLLAACSGGPVDTRGEPSSFAPDAAAAPAPVLIKIQNSHFKPPKLTVPKGTTVTWENFDTVEHTATSLGRGFASSPLALHKTFRFKFVRPGTYDYFCQIHPYMKGVIQVTK